MSAQFAKIVLIGLVLAAVLIVSSPVASQPRALSDLHAMVVGVGADGQVIAAGVPLTSGPWGTDYITVSHVLRMGRQYSVMDDGKSFTAATGLAACSSQYHGIDVLILRVKARQSAVVEWADPAGLKAGDELAILPRREFPPELVTVRFLHVNLLEWTKSKPSDWSQAWHNVMVADGMSKAGFSGSPWVREGKVYGLLKGRVRPARQDKWYVVAETSSKVQECLKQLHYDDLIPRE